MSAPYFISATIVNPLDAYYDGSSIDFVVVMGGSAPFTYAWYRNGTLITGEELATMTYGPLASTDAGMIISVKVTNADGYTWYYFPAIEPLFGVSPLGAWVTPLSSYNVAVGDTKTLEVTLLTGSTPYTYQWWITQSATRSPGPIDGATSATYTTPTAVIGDNDWYTCTITNAYGTWWPSHAVWIHTDGAPVITVQPVNLTVAEGSNAYFHIEAVEDPAVTYQWRRGGVNVTDVTFPAFPPTSSTWGTAAAIYPDDDGSNYDCVVTNSFGSTTSTLVYLTVTDGGGGVSTQFINQPQDVSVPAGQAATFTCRAVGPGTLTYRWRKNGANIAVGNGLDVYQTPTTVLADSGAHYDVVVASSAETIVSNTVTLTVTAGGGGGDGGGGGGPAGGLGPVILDFTPASGPEGTVVTINGYNFGGLLTVQFDGNTCTTTFLTGTTKIEATVPVGATTGIITVTTINGVAVTGGGPSTDDDAYWLVSDIAGALVEVVTPWTSDDIMRVKYTQSADVMTLVHPDYPPHNLSRYDRDVWLVTEAIPDTGPWLGINVDKTKTVHATGDAGTVKLTASTKHFFKEANTGQLFYMETRNYGTPWETGKDVAAKDVRRSDGKYYEAQNAGKTGTLRPVQWTDTWNDGGVDWLYLHSGWGVLRIAEMDDAEGYSCWADVIGEKLPSMAIMPGTGSSSEEVYQTCEPYETTDHYLGLVIMSHGMDVGSDGYVDVWWNGAWTEYSHFHITRRVLKYHVEDEDTLSTNFSVRLNREPLNDVIHYKLLGGTSSGDDPTGTYRWQFGAWGGEQGWPSVVGYHQGRRVFGATPQKPHTFWFSRTDSYDSFDLSVPIQDDDPLTATLASSQVDGIRGMISMDKLMILTAGANWVLAGGQSEVIAPGNMNVKVQGFRGTSHLFPLGVGDSTLYIQDKGQVVRDLNYDFASDHYTGNDLTVFANHLTEGMSIVDWAYQQHPFTIIWMIRDDGALLGLTYMKEQQVVGWHRHDTNGCFESIACVSEGQEDAVYVIVKRGVGDPQTATRYIERMNTRLVTNVADGLFLDCALSSNSINTDPTRILTLSGGSTWSDGETIAATMSYPLFVVSNVGDFLSFKYEGVTYKLTITGYTSPSTVNVMPNLTIPLDWRDVPHTDWSLGQNTYGNLSHLEAKSVMALVDGVPAGPFTVVDGAISLEAAGVTVHVGLPIVADLVTLDVAQAGQEFVSNKRKAIAGLSMQVLEANSVWAGRDTDHLYEVLHRSDQLGLPTRLQDGMMSAYISTDWGTGGSIAIRHTDPLPITITSLIPEVTIGES